MLSCLVISYILSHHVWCYLVLSYLISYLIMSDVILSCHIYLLSHHVWCYLVLSYLSLISSCLTSSCFVNVMRLNCLLNWIPSSLCSLFETMALGLANDKTSAILMVRYVTLSTCTLVQLNLLLTLVIPLFILCHSPLLNIETFILSFYTYLFIHSFISS